jgi:hypothetical protein
MRRRVHKDTAGLTSRQHIPLPGHQIQIFRLQVSGTRSSRDDEQCADQDNQSTKYHGSSEIIIALIIAECGTALEMLQHSQEA